MVMDDPVQKIPTTLVTADSTGAPDAGGLGCHFNPALRFNRNSKELTTAERDNYCWLPILPVKGLVICFCLG